MSTFDQDPKRSTFQVTYPTTPILSLGNDYRNVLASNNVGQFECKSEVVKINTTRKYFENVVFLQCQFYCNPNVIIDKISFRNCHFTQCFLGSITFSNCRFENCRISECDLSNSKIVECIFENCYFIKNTAFHANFISSEIDAKRFLNQIVFREEHYTRTNIPKNEIAHAKREFIHSKFSLSKALYNSNTQSGNFFLSDVSLYQLKLNERKSLLDRFRHQHQYNLSSKENVFFCILKRPLLLLKITKDTINIIITQGGTSYKRLFLTAIILIIIYNFYFSISSIGYDKFLYAEPSNLLMRYIYWLPKSLTMFFGFGYGAAITTTIWQQLMVTSFGILGTFWYAILIPVLFRRIYK